MNAPFASRVLSKLIQDGALLTSDSIVAVCGAPEERDLFQSLGFERVTICNNANMKEYPNGYKSGYRPDAVHPYSFSFQDAQRLEFPDKSFDLAFVSDGLHHCSSPHRAMTEMYRVARKGIVIFESRDSLLMKLAVLFGLTHDFEVDIISRDYQNAGVDSTDIPNFVYRWTEREIEKTIRSYDPTGRQRFCYYYDVRLPILRYKEEGRRALYAIATAINPVVGLAKRIFPRQCNNFAVAIMRPDETRLWPWLTMIGDQIAPNKDYK